MIGESQATLECFVDDAPAGPPPIVLDRSTLERWSQCPHQAAMVDRRMVSTSSDLTDVGNEVHRIIAEAVRIRATEGITPHDMREYIQAEAVKSRPDVQPQVIMALRKAYPIVGLICYPGGSASERNPDDLLRYDGGEGEHAGQLAADILPGDDERGPVRVTGEMDLLMATPSVEELELIDWKSGWRWWTATEVEAAFQFQCYAVLVFLNFPKVQRVRVRVFMTAYGEITGAVEFTRENDLFTFIERIKTAAGVCLRHHKTEDVGDVPAWPSPDKCSICPAAKFCKEAHRPARDIATDTEGAVRQLVALEAAAGSLRANLTTARRKNGADFVFDGVAFGIDRPRKTRAPACEAYEWGTREPDFGTPGGE